MWRGLGLTVCGGMLAAATLAAHHSIAGAYDSATQVSIEGTVEQFHFVNPHPFVTVIVTGAQGGPVSWRLEMDNRFELEAIGLTSRALVRGDRIVASGSRGRNNANSLYVLRLDRTVDGFWYEQVGSTPRTGNRSKG
jgi:hypothetical protein